MLGWPLEWGVIETTVPEGLRLLDVSALLDGDIDGDIRGRIPPQVPSLLQYILGGSKTGETDESECELHYNNV